MPLARTPLFKYHHPPEKFTFIVQSNKSANLSVYPSASQATNMEFASKKLNADKVLNILCTILKLSGLWTPFNKAASVQVLYKAYGTVFQTFFFVFFVTSLVGGVLTVEKINNISSRLPLTVAEVAMVPKLIPVFFSNRALQQIRHNIENFDVLSPSEHIVADTHLSFYRKMIILFALFPQMTILGWTISSLLSPDRQLIFGAWCPGFDWQNSQTDYWTLQAYQYISSFITAYYNITIDMYYCFAMYVVSVEFKLLGERFISMQAIDSFQSSRQLLVSHAKTLNTIRSSIGVVEFCMGWSYVTQVLMSVLCICSLTNELARV